MNERDTERLAKLCGLLGSDHEGERANAAALASKKLREIGLTWRDLVERAVRGAAALEAPRHEPRPPQPSAPRLHPKARIRWLQQHSEWLSDWESGFINGLARQARPLTPKQVSKLNEIHEQALGRSRDTWGDAE